MTQADGLSYKDYLKVDRLLSLQKPRSKPAQHDETLFIIIHQTFELWFKEILNELEAVHRSLMKLNVREAIRLMNRVVTIEKLLIDQIHVLETMRPEDFRSATRRCWCRLAIRTTAASSTGSKAQDTNDGCNDCRVLPNLHWYSLFSK